MSSFYSGPNLRLNDGVLDRMLNSPGGEVGRYLNRVGVKILVGAQAMVGIRTGNLRRSLHMRHSRDGRGQYVKVGSDLDYAYVHHEGARPHQIRATTGRMLRFRSGGRMVHVRSVNHPGFRGRKYLTVPMRRAVR